MSATFDSMRIYDRTGAHLEAACESFETSFHTIKKSLPVKSDTRLRLVIRY